MEDFIKEYKKGQMSLNELVRSACMCGAVEERHRTLQIVRECDAGANWMVSTLILKRICGKSALEVLGYEKETKHGTDRT